MNPIDLIARVIDIMHKPPEETIDGRSIITERSDYAPPEMAWGAWIDGDEEGIDGRGPTREAAIAELKERLS